MKVFTDFCDLTDKERQKGPASMLTYYGDSFINTGTGKCSFQSQNFPDILEYAKFLPEKLNMDAYDEDYWRNYEAQYKEGRSIKVKCNNSCRGRRHVRK